MWNLKKHKKQKQEQSSPTQRTEWWLPEAESSGGEMKFFFNYLTMPYLLIYSII